MRFFFSSPGSLVVHGGDPRVDLHCDCPKDGSGQSLDSQAGPGAELEDQGGGVQQERLVGAHSHED